MSLLPLHGNGKPECGRGCLVHREMGDAPLPESDVDAGRFEELWRQHGVSLATRQSKIEEGVFRLRLDLGRKHARGGAPCLTIRHAAIHDQHLVAGQREFPRTSRPNSATADYDNIKCGRHL